MSGGLVPGSVSDPPDDVTWRLADTPVHCTQASLTRGSRLGRIVARLFGRRRPNRLADLRLETLRRFSVAVAHNKVGLAAWERSELRALKLSESQINEALALATLHRRDRRSGSLLSVLLGPALLAAHLLVRGIVGDAMISAIVVSAIATLLGAAVTQRGSREASSWPHPIDHPHRTPLATGRPSFGSAISARTAH